MELNDTNRNLLISLLKCDIFKVGNFKLKSGSFSPVYIDLRRIIAFPSVIKDLAAAIRSKQINNDLKADVICGVPYTALPVASVFSVFYDVPMVMKRKEAKDHGTKKLVEGKINTNDSCLIIEDIVSSGTSIIETAEALRKEGLKVEACIVVINRNQGGMKNLEKAGIKLYPLFDVDTLFEAYCSINEVESDLKHQVLSYFKDNSYLPVLKTDLTSTVSYSERAKMSSHSVAKRLFEIMEQKTTNLCVAVDTKSSKDLLDLASRLGPYICVLKTHVDILEDFNENLPMQLKNLSRLHNFLIMEDRKFADIGNTVKAQFLGGLYKIQSWADLVTVHSIPGEGIVKALADKECALVLIAEMSSKGTLTNEEYREKTFAMAESNRDCVVGYVAQTSYPKGNFIHMCPGVNIAVSGDSLGQQYKSPEEVVSSGADVVIVGRGICEAQDLESSATEYRNRSYAAYLKRISS